MSEVVGSLLPVACISSSLLLPGQAFMICRPLRSELADENILSVSQLMIF